MEYTVEELSPVKKKINVSVSGDEVDAALAGALALLKKDVQLDGFRKGKVPASVIAKRFHADIEKEARDNLINVHINDIVDKTGSRPVSAITMSGEDAPLVKGQPFQYTMEFEVMPTFDLPPYEGLAEEEEEAVATPEKLDQMVNRLREMRAQFVPVDGSEPAKDGQIATIDFDIIEDGKPLEDYKGKGVNLAIGRGEALSEFEQLVKTIPQGHTGEGPVTFPEDFLSKELAGKTLTAKITVHAVKEKKLPELDDTFAESWGYENAASVRETMKKSMLKVENDLHKSATEKKLLDKLVKQVDFELPPSFVDTEVFFLINDLAERMERVGKSIATTKEDLDKLREEMRPQGEERAREKIVLLAIAKKENLDVKPEEVAREVYRGSRKIGVDYKEYFAKMQDSGLIFKLRENMLCDKAMDLVYDRATITKVPARPAEQEQEKAESETAE